MTVETATYVGELDTALPAGTDTKSEGDNHIRLMKSVLQATLGTPTGKLCRTQSKSSNYTVVAGDVLSIIETTAALTLALTAVATLGHFAFILIAKAPTTLDPNASELVNGETTLLCQGVYLIKSNGSAWEAIPLHAQSGMKNAIINGDFNVWQRGTSFAAIGSGNLSADRWKWISSSAAVVTVSRSTDVPTVAQAGRLFNYSLNIEVTTADASIAAGDISYLLQPIEGYNWLRLAQRPIVVGFWMKAAVTGVYSVSLNNDGNDRCFPTSVTVNSADTWEWKTAVFLASPSGGTWNYTNGIGANLGFVLAAGTNFHQTAGAWFTGANGIAVSSQVNALATIGNYVRITGVQLEVGSIATEFEQRAFAQELALCQRYYEKSFELDTAPAQNAGIGGSWSWPATAGNIGQYIVPVQFKVRKRAIPTIITYNPSAANAEARNHELGLDCSGIAPGASQTTISATLTGAVGQTAGTQQLRVHWTASAEL